MAITLDKEVLAHKNLKCIDFFGGSSLTLVKTDDRYIDICLVERTSFRQKFTGGMVSTEVVAYQIFYKNNLYLVDPFNISQHLLSILENPANEIPAIENLAIQKREAEGVDESASWAIWGGRDKISGTYVDSE